jgi:prevent-host-death family protein
MQLGKVKATLSAVVDEAVGGESTIITRHGKPEAVVVGFKEWKKLSSVPSFADLLLQFPLEPDELPERDRRPFQPVDL